MTRFEPNTEHAGGMASLQVAEAHPTTLLNLSSSLDGKAMFIVGADLALFGVFVGAIAALDASWLAIIPAAMIMAAIAAFGWRTVRPRDAVHFPVASIALALRGSGQPNDQVDGSMSRPSVWPRWISPASSIARATHSSGSLSARPSRSLRWL